MSKSGSRWMQRAFALSAAVAAFAERTLAYAATLAVLGASVCVPVEPALAAQRPVAREIAAARTRPVELAFSLIEQPGQKQGMADGSVKQGMGDGSVKSGRNGSPAAKKGVGVIAPGSNGGRQGLANGLHTGGVKGAGAQLPAVQR